MRWRYGIKKREKGGGGGEGGRRLVGGRDFANSQTLAKKVEIFGGTSA